jgi:hypothetical protein
MSEEVEAIKLLAGPNPSILDPEKYFAHKGGKPILRFELLKYGVMKLWKLAYTANLIPHAVVGTRPNTAYIQKVFDTLMAQMKEAKRLFPQSTNGDFLNLLEAIRNIVVQSCDDDDAYAWIFIRFFEIARELPAPPPTNKKNPAFWYNRDAI